MDDVFELYESVYFEGVPIGFATENILNKQDNTDLEAVLIYKTEYVKQSELDAVQGYLDRGGIVIVDSSSLHMDEYGNPLGQLTESNGTLTVLDQVSGMKTTAMQVVADRGMLPEVAVTEINGIGVKGCAWKCVKNAEGKNVLSVVNLGKTDATLTIELKDSETGTVCKDLIDGIRVSSNPVLKPYETFFVEVTAATEWDDPINP